MKKQPIAYHPGEHLKDELKARKRTQRKFAILSGLSTVELSQIIVGGRRIDARKAVSIADAFGMEPTMWLGLQNMFDLYELRKKESKKKPLK